MSKVIRVDRTVGKFRWRLELSCGCIAIIPAPRRPNRMTHPCDKHPAVPPVGREARR